FVSLKSRLISALFLLASLISSLACLTPLVSSSMILSVLLENLAFVALNSKFLLNSLIEWLLSSALFK
ncbi:hypothetical protein, partial [Helicobacter pylori]